MNDCRSIYGLGTLNIHEKRFFRDQSVLVSFIVLWKVVCNFVLTIVSLIHCDCLRALFGGVGYIMRYNGTTENSRVEGIYRSNRLPLE